MSDASLHKRSPRSRGQPYPLGAGPVLALRGLSPSCADKRLRLRQRFSLISPLKQQMVSESSQGFRDLDGMVLFQENIQLLPEIQRCQRYQVSVEVSLEQQLDWHQGRSVFSYFSYHFSLLSLANEGRQNQGILPAVSREVPSVGQFAGQEGPSALS